MIDWTQIDRTSRTDWLRLAETLMQRGIAAIQTAEKQGLRASHEDLLEFVEKATLACPVDVLTSVNTASRQIASALLAVDVQALGERSALLDAAGAKISVVANATRAEAARLRLVEVRRALDGLIDLAGEIRDLRDGLSSIPKRDVPTRLDAILDLLAKLEQRARASLA